MIAVTPHESCSGKSIIRQHLPAKPSRRDLENRHAHQIADQIKFNRGWLGIAFLALAKAPGRRVYKKSTASVLSALRFYLGSNPYTWARLSVLAEDAGVSVKTFSRKLDWLEEQGLIRREHTLYRGGNGVLHIHPMIPSKYARFMTEPLPKEALIFFASRRPYLSGGGGDKLSMQKESRKEEEQAKQSSNTNISGVSGQEPAQSAAAAQREEDFLSGGLGSAPQACGKEASGQEETSAHRDGSADLPGASLPGLSGGALPLPAQGLQRCASSEAATHPPRSADLPAREGSGGGEVAGRGTQAKSKQPLSSPQRSRRSAQNATRTPDTAQESPRTPETAPGLKDSPQSVRGALRAWQKILIPLVGFLESQGFRCGQQGRFFRPEWAQHFTPMVLMNALDVLVARVLERHKNRESVGSLWGLYRCILEAVKRGEHCDYVATYQSVKSRAEGYAFHRRRVMVSPDLTTTLEAKAAAKMEGAEVDGVVMGSDTSSPSGPRNKGVSEPSTEPDRDAEKRGQEERRGILIAKVVGSFQRALSTGRKHVVLLAAFALAEMNRNPSLASSLQVEVHRHEGPESFIQAIEGFFPEDLKTALRDAGVPFEVLPDAASLEPGEETETDEVVEIVGEVDVEEEEAGTASNPGEGAVEERAFSAEFRRKLRKELVRVMGRGIWAYEGVLRMLVDNGGDPGLTLEFERRVNEEQTDREIIAWIMKICEEVV